MPRGSVISRDSKMTCLAARLLIAESASPRNPSGYFWRARPAAATRLSGSLACRRVSSACLLSVRTSYRMIQNREDFSDFTLPVRDNFLEGTDERTGNSRWLQPLQPLSHIAGHSGLSRRIRLPEQSPRNSRLSDSPRPGTSRKSTDYEQIRAAKVLNRNILGLA
jgi:hypothetical protein